MLGFVGNFLKHPLRFANAVATDPIGAWTVLQDRFVASLERNKCSSYRYDTDPDWERRLHDVLGVAWPCKATSEFWSVWPEVIEGLKEKGIQVGPESFALWNDGDAAFVRAIWCFVRHQRPRNVVETGVAHGVSSRIILEALERNAREGNGGGHLWSIDLAPQEPILRKRVGIAVGDRFKHRWTYINGSSRRCLPRLLAELGQIDLFIHDSLHSERNVRFEVDRAWAILRPGCAIVIDDIDSNRGFQSFKETFCGHQSLACEAEPIRPDLRRHNNKGVFGIILKEPATPLKPVAVP